jgi:hypothetical protein
MEMTEENSLNWSPRVNKMVKYIFNELNLLKNINKLNWLITGQNFENT